MCGARVCMAGLMGLCKAQKNSLTLVCRILFSIPLGTCVMMWNSAHVAVTYQSSLSIDLEIYVVMKTNRDTTSADILFHLLLRIRKTVVIP
jgi:hypothetical protein